MALDKVNLCYLVMEEGRVQEKNLDIAIEVLCINKSLHNEKKAIFFVFNLVILAMANVWSEHMLIVLSPSTFPSHSN